MASHGPGAMAPDVANLEPGGKPKPKKKPASKANKPAAKKPAGKAASAAKKPSPAKAKAKTPGQGGLGTQIGSLIAKHMAKMFKEDVNESGTYGPSPGYKNRDEFQAAMKKRRTEKKDTSDWKYSATNFVNPSKIDAVNHPSKVENPRKAAIVLGNKETKPDPYEHDTQTKKWLIHQSLMRRVAKEKSLQNKETKEKKSHNHPVAGFLGKTLLGVAKHTLFASVNDQIERLLFETEDTPNYHVHVLLSKGVVGDKSFRRHNLDVVRPIYTGAPNEPFDTKWLNNIITNDEQINLYCDEGYKIEEIFGSDDSNLCEKEMNEKHAHMVRVNDAIRRKFLPTEEYENDRSQ